MKKFICLLLTFITILALYNSVPAEFKATQAVNLTKHCKISVSSNSKYKNRMLNSQINNYWPCKSGDTITVILPENQKAQGIAISFLGDIPELTVTQDDKDIGSYTERFVAGYISFLELVDVFTITVRGEADKYRINRLNIYSEGILPQEVQQWNRLEEQADLMLIATHMDDELLWFGGLLPTYAGEQNKKVIVVNMVGNDTKRRCEFLDGLWTCGIRYYPEIGPFPDRNARAVETCFALWGRTEPQQYLTQLIRKYKPKVVVTQDVNGEYGHAHHKVTAQAAIDAVTQLAGNPEFDPETAQEYGTWIPQKFYVHLWKENVTDFDWSVPLEAFGGETSLSVAKRAFKKHVSQQKGKYHVLESGKLDSSLMGLYMSNVGLDTGIKDLFEHVE